MVILAKLDIVVSRVRPIWYMVFYLMAIPAFGALYALAVPHGFYEPYARFEPSTALDALRVREILQDQIGYSLKAHYAGGFEMGDSTLISLATVPDLDMSDERALSFTAIIIGDKIGGKSYAAVRVRLSGAMIWLGSTSDPSGHIDLYEVTATVSSSEPELSPEKKEALLRSLFPPIKYQSYLALTDQNGSVLQSYLEGVRGNPSAVSGAFYRMTYLSAVVITTLGLGDIVPISSRARFLIALEAIVGVVLAGLFLNALAFARIEPDSAGRTLYSHADCLPVIT